MRPEALALFQPDGMKAGELELRSFASADDHVLEGALVAGDGRWFPILEGVPSFLTGILQRDLSEFARRHDLPLKATTTGLTAAEQAKTNETFSDKWRRFKNYGFEDAHKEFLFDWYRKKFGFQTVEELKAFYKSRRRILECGPGSGFNTRFMAENTDGEVFALDISDAAFTTFGNTKGLPNCSVIQADLMAAPFADESFDFIIADGVLHHTPDTRAAVEALYRKLAPGGQFFFYVYRKMGAARQFCDAHIREHFTKLSPEDCYVACEGLTDLGRALSKLGATITLEKPIPVLGIPAGTHDVQRLIYYNFVKCFWNEAFDYETNNMVNFDWYHPHNAWQHTGEEVESWLKGLGVETFTFNDANPNGISVLLTKPAG
ncbi:class I SAM-dependent methyltransferase [Bradyrhizobium uaiense]|uniref:Class I SAM-dependent methyltransferase n=1 Tax=Bradyrhizobium uaiense TaxID=2594946 RepID=A0A6P1BFF3_9BRAD|nr:class I SAM-dependent methyltransferase [Bradyrhizobium uaiense]NEU96212.1 class I SAM-dependent methyltransferase [Bradyrhizobium uaiense]